MLPPVRTIFQPTRDKFSRFKKIENMKRQEQIKEMAKFHAKHMTCDKDMQVAFADALRRGAEWSDEHPDIDVRTMAAWRSGYQAAIDKACEWLEEEYPKAAAYYEHPDCFIDQFRKAMI